MEYGQPMRVVAKRTGISPHLIRMWERRYSAITPARTETGRRLYTDEEIERLILLRRATLEGQAISQIANLPTDQLRTLAPAESNDIKEASANPNSASVEQHFNFCLQSMENLDAVELEIRLLRASINLGQQAFLEKLLHPLLETTGEMWSDGRLNVAHEHLASAVVRSLLGSMSVSSNADRSAPLLVGTTPMGQHHEFGTLMALVTASSSGWRTLYLGANLPAEDIIESVTIRHADALALSIVYPPDDPRLTEELRKLSRLTAKHIPILVGGRSASAYSNILDEIDAIKITGFTDLRRELEQIKKTAFPPAKKLG